MSKLLFPGPLFRAPISAPVSPQTFTFASDGDPGVFEFLGRNYGTAIWTNPYTATRLGITVTPNTGGDLPAMIVDRMPSHFSTDSGAPHIIFDLGVGNGLIITNYGYQFRDETTTFTPTAFEIAGSADGSDWSHLVDSQSGLSASLSGWVHQSIMGEVTPYRYWRILQTAFVDGSFFSIGEFELFGEFSF